jgi:hypothetical protein
VFPGSKESGAARQSKVSVPPLCVDGFTTLVTPALYAGAEPAPLPLLPPLLLLLPLLLQAASVRAATAPIAASPYVLRLLIR